MSRPYRSGSFTLILSLLLYVVSCSSDDDIVAQGPVITIERVLTDFSKLNMKGVGEVEVLKGQENKIEITTHENLFEVITTDVLNGTLVIDLVAEVEKVEELSFKVYTTEDLDDITLKGVGDINYPGPLSPKNLKITLDGVGNITISNINSEIISARLTAVGEIVLSGSADSVYYLMDGVGSIHGFELLSVSGDVVLNGVGDIEVNASDNLYVTHSGTGKIKYMGNPEVYGSTNDVEKVN